MLNRTISLDPEVAELVNELGGLAGLLYTWIIAHLDRDGRISGNPMVLCAQVTPLIVGVTPELVRSTLARANYLDLVDVYCAEGKDWVVFPKFQQNQKGMRYDREAAGAAPEPSGLTPEWIRTYSGPTPPESKAKQRKGKECNEREEKRIARSDSGESQPAPPSISMPTTRDAYGIWPSDIVEWSEAYPAVKVAQALREMRQWCISNPTKVKTPRGVRGFITRWLGKEQNRGGNSGRTANRQSTFREATNEAMEWANAEDEKDRVCSADDQAAGVLPKHGS